jgi:dolichol-phosphate mannosyltransferase
MNIPLQVAAEAASTAREWRVAVIVPAYKVRDQILDVLAGVPPFVSLIYVVDDACPEGTGKWVLDQCDDRRVRVLTLQKNQGVGGAVMAGYREALKDGADVLVKMDGDGQMDAGMLPRLLRPLLRGEADYTKGNRFYDLAEIQRMPVMRLAGNAVLSFMNKLSSGYWDLFDPTNGYTALHASVARNLHLDKISRRYFFESDMLFRLNIIRAVVADVPMDARYGSESSNLKIARVAHDFFFKHLRNGCKRIFYNYFLRDLSLASFELVLGLLFIGTGSAMGLAFWIQSFQTGVETGAGSVMLSALQIIVGIQLLLGFLAYDIASIPKRPLHQLLREANPENTP